MAGDDAYNAAMMQPAEILPCFRPFQQLEHSLLSRLAALSRIVEVGRDAVLCRQGTQPEALHYLLEGQIALTQATPDGSATLIDVVQPVRSVTLASVVAGQTHMLTAQALKPSRVLEVPGGPLRALISERPGFAKAMLESLSLEMDAITRMVVDLKLRSSAQRLGCFLLALAEQPGATQAEFELPFQKRLLAERIGCRFEHLSRAFALLRKYGVETRGARVALRDIPRLREFAVAEEGTPNPPSSIARAARALGDAFKF